MSNEEISVFNWASWRWVWQTTRNGVGDFWTTRQIRVGSARLATCRKTISRVSVGSRRTCGTLSRRRHCRRQRTKDFCLLFRRMRPILS